MSNDETFGDRLRNRMKEKGVTMPALAVGLKPRKNGVLEGDLGRAAVYGWINGNGFPNVIQLAAICKKLDISSDYLLFGGISSAVSPQMERAASAVKELTEEERMALFAAVQTVPTPDVKKHVLTPTSNEVKRFVDKMPQNLGSPIQETHDDSGVRKTKRKGT